MASNPKEPRPFVTRYPVNYHQHKRRIETMVAEGLHDGIAWKPEAHDRYAQLEEADQRSLGATISSGMVRYLDMQDRAASPLPAEPPPTETAEEWYARNSMRAAAEPQKEE